MKDKTRGESCTCGRNERCLQSGNLQGRNYLGHPTADGRIILECKFCGTEFGIFQRTLLVWKATNYFVNGKSYERL
jgi:hypothetical protein